MYPMYHYSKLRNPSTLMLAFIVIMNEEHEVYEDVTSRIKVIP